MHNLITYRVDNPIVFNSWLILVEKVAMLTDEGPKDICFTKTEGNLHKFLYIIPLKQMFWFTLKERSRAEFSIVVTASHAR